MPRAYFIQFLNVKAEEDDSVLDCLDLYQEFQILRNALDFIKKEVDDLEREYG